MTDAVGKTERFAHFPVRTLLEGDMLDREVTGLCRSAGLADAMFSHYSGRPDSYILFIDWDNLRNINVATSRNYGNRFMGACTSMLSSLLHAHMQPETCVGFKLDQHGDEIFFVFTAPLLTPDRIDALQAAVQSALTLFAGESTLASLAHSKPERPPGIGVTASVRRIDGANMDGCLDALHAATRQKKRALSSGAAGNLPDSLQNPSAQARLKTALDRFAARHAMRPPALEPDFIARHETVACSLASRRTERNEALKAARPDDIFVRIDIKGLRYLNDSGDVEAVNALLRVFSSRLEQALPEDAQYFDVGGGIYDMVIPGRCKDTLAELLADAETIFSESAGQYPALTSGSEQAALATAIVPVAGNTFTALLETADRIKSFCERWNCGYRDFLGCADFSPLAAMPEIMAKKLAQGEACPDAVKASLSMPVGFIAAEWMGKDIAAAASANFAIQHLVAAGMPEETIEAHASSPDEFSSFLKTVPSEAVVRLNMADSPGQVCRLKSLSLMTLSLAEKWGILDARSKDLILCAQLAVRTRADLDTPAPPLSPQDALKAVRMNANTVFAQEPGTMLRDIQRLHETANCLKLLDRAGGGEGTIDQAVKIAIRAELSQALRAVADAARDYPLFTAALSQIAGENDPPRPHAARIIENALTGGLARCEAQTAHDLGVLLAPRQQYAGAQPHHRLP